jgi:hypothetical protein
VSASSSYLGLRTLGTVALVSVHFRLLFQALMDLERNSRCTDHESDVPPCLETIQFPIANSCPKVLVRGVSNCPFLLVLHCTFSLVAGLVTHPRLVGCVLTNATVWA